MGGSPFSNFITAFSKRGSLRVQLTLQVAILAALGLGSMTGWSAWQMRRMLLGSHQRTLDYVTERFMSDVAIYADKSSVAEAMGTAIAKIPDGGNDDSNNVMVWVEAPQREVVAMSSAASKDSMTLQELRPQIPFPSRSHLVDINGRYLLVCGEQLSYDEEPIGKLYLAYDVTQERQTYVEHVRNLALANLLLLILLVGAIAYRVYRVTTPLKTLSETASRLSAADLGTTTLEVNKAPEEIAGLVEAFNAMLLRLSSSWDKQRQFVNDASHELRTPLTIVHGYLQSVLRRKESLNPLQQEALGTAAEETQRTIHMLQEMLEIARSDSGQLSFDLRPIALQPLLNSVASTIQEVHQRSVGIQAPQQPVAAIADPNHLRQALLNLLENAVKYSEPGDAICLSLRAQSGLATVTVQDEGIGIEPEHLNCVFERFYRADEARNRKGGTGLGLAVVKTLVEGMGGAIAVQSELDKGSTFTISLPRS